MISTASHLKDTKNYFALTVDNKVSNTPPVVLDSRKNTSIAFYKILKRQQLRGSTFSLNCCFMIDTRFERATLSFGGSRSIQLS